MYSKSTLSERAAWKIIFLTLSWIVWSNLTILFNKWILESTGFRYPIILTSWHLIFATVATQVLARTTSILDGRKTITMDTKVYLQKIAPIGLLYSGSLVCSNIAYLYLNISFIQMLKASAAGPVVTLLTSWFWGVAELSAAKVANILIITLSVALAVSGEIQFSWLGVGFQLAALVFDANRLIMIQILLSDNDGQKMDPLVSLYYSAPVCALMNLFLAWRTEFATFQWSAVAETGVGMLLLNAIVGFMLNVSVFTLIGKTSGLTMTLVSIPKNVLLILASIVIWHTRISFLQGVGYSIALLGLVVYSMGWARIKSYVQAPRKDEPSSLV
ncbi:hypothetical protein ARAM_007226 [Aspergillus rambellii]|uniref:Sugar phosphate transporter domain-containing protein n=2 Tax=Aspergillus subgen. Nidulantes TaxID=2720870 RepID=A0A0F8V3N8_9EURO|nr:hypothetical protein AOCH_006368 [Aspergillus ochraceoroseus]KKK26378.1 hypothetical protein ARAM_007226 [Aspergillus rambellii]